MEIPKSSSFNIERQTSPTDLKKKSSNHRPRKRGLREKEKSPRPTGNSRDTVRATGPKNSPISKTASKIRCILAHRHWTRPPDSHRYRETRLDGQVPGYSEDLRSQKFVNFKNHFERTLHFAALTLDNTENFHQVRSKSRTSEFLPTVRHAPANPTFCCHMRQT